MGVHCMTDVHCRAGTVAYIGGGSIPLAPLENTKLKGNKFKK